MENKLFAASAYVKNYDGKNNSTLFCTLINGYCREIAENKLLSLITNLMPTGKIIAINVNDTVLLDDVKIDDLMLVRND